MVGNPSLKVRRLGVLFLTPTNTWCMFKKQFFSPITSNIVLTAEYFHSQDLIPGTVHNL